MNQNKDASPQISINPSFIARKLSLIVLFLVIANIVVQVIKYLTGHRSVFGLVHLFDLNQEKNIPSFFSVFLLLTSALLLFVIAIHEKKIKASDVSKWAILSLIFLYLAADEAFSFHERMDSLGVSLVGERPHNIFYFSWVIPGIAIAFIVAIFFVRFFLRLNTKTRLNFLIAAILYVGGAIGFELIGGQYLSSIEGKENLAYNLLVTVEETLEMVGPIVFIYGLLSYISENFTADEKCSLLQRVTKIINPFKTLLKA